MTERRWTVTRIWHDVMAETAVDAIEMTIGTAHDETKAQVDSRDAAARLQARITETAVATQQNGDQMLATIRAAHERYVDAYEADRTLDAPAVDALLEVAYMFQMLDKWMSDGFSLPRAWEDAQA